MRRFQPTGSNVLVRLGPRLETIRATLLEVELHPASDDVPQLIQSEGHQYSQRIGEVVAVGPGRLQSDGSREQLGIKTGDTVVFGAYNWIDLTEALGADDGHTYGLMQQWKQAFSSAAPDIYGRLVEDSHVD